MIIAAHVKQYSVLLLLRIMSLKFAYQPSS